MEWMQHRRPDRKSGQVRFNGQVTIFFQKKTV